MAASRSEGEGAVEREIIEVITDSDSECDLISSSNESIVSESDEDNASGLSDEEVQKAPSASASPSAKRARQSEISWKKGVFTPKAFTFDSSGSGIRADCALPAAAREIDCFKMFFDGAVMDNIASETNEYARTLKNNPELKENSKMQKWTDTCVSEIYVFLAATMLMSLTVKNTLKEYWSTDPTIATPFFSKLFSLDRFSLLLRALHFSRIAVAEDPLRKIRPIIAALLKKFSLIFSPYQDLCIDESLVHWKGRLSFKQYIPSKRHRFGIKIFVICDVKTGYILNYIVYIHCVRTLNSRMLQTWECPDLLWLLL